MIVFGFAWYERQDAIDPTAIALPSAQWQEVCAHLANGVPDDAVAGVNLGLSFMNSGPSAYCSWLREANGLPHGHSHVGSRCGIAFNTLPLLLALAGGRVPWVIVGRWRPWRPVRGR